MGRHALRGIIGDICLANLHRREVSIDAIARTPLFWDMFLVPPKLIPGRSATPCTSGTPASGASPAKDPKSAFGSAPPPPCLRNPSSLGQGSFPAQQAERALHLLPREQQGGWGSPETSSVSLPAPNLLFLRTGPLPTPSASGTSCLMERELAPGKTMNFNASGHSSHIESSLPGLVVRSLEFMGPNPLLHT